MPDFTGYTNMVFVDGENLTIRGQEFARAHGIQLVQGRYWEPDTFLWLPGVEGSAPFVGTATRAERAYYYTAVVGDDERLMTTRLAIRNLGFDPNVFKKAKGTRSKGVDVSLTTAVVSHAYRGSYEIAFLVAGDGDYAPMVEEAKRAGRRIVVAFFENYGLNPALRIAADVFIDLGEHFALNWRREIDDLFLEARVDELVARGVTQDRSEIADAMPDLSESQVVEIRSKMTMREMDERNRQRIFGTQQGTRDS
jgi:hypothetical protein